MPTSSGASSRRGSGGGGSPRGPLTPRSSGGSPGGAGSSRSSRAGTPVHSSLGNTSSSINHPNAAAATGTAGGLMVSGHGLQLTCFTPEPHLIPRYTGTVPGLKFELGKTYGQASHLCMTQQQQQQQQATQGWDGAALQTTALQQTAYQPLLMATNRQQQMEAALGMDPYHQSGLPSSSDRRGNDGDAAVPGRPRLDSAASFASLQSLSFEPGSESAGPGGAEARRTIPSDVAPGYTGTIPGFKGHLGRSAGVAARKSLHRHHRQQARQRRADAEMETTQAAQARTAIHRPILTNGQATAGGGGGLSVTQPGPAEAAANAGTPGGARLAASLPMPGRSGGGTVPLQELAITHGWGAMPTADNTAFTPRVVYSQTVGVVPGATIHVPQRRFLDTGKSYGRLTREAARGLRSGLAPSWTPRELERKTQTLAMTGGLQEAQTRTTPGGYRAAARANDRITRPVFDKPKHRQWIV